MIHKVLDDHAVDAERAERGKKRRIRRRIVDQAVITRAKIPRRKNTDDKSQQFVGHLAADDPARIFNDFVLPECL